MLQTVPYPRSFAQALSGTPTALAIPSDVAPVEVWVQGSAGFNVRGNPASGSDAAFALLASTIYRFPYNETRALLFDGSGTLSVLVFGIPNVTPVPSR
jgi:hypothetical protein